MEGRREGGKEKEDVVRLFFIFYNFLFIFYEEYTVR